MEKDNSMISRIAGDDQLAMNTPSKKRGVWLIFAIVLLVILVIIGYFVYQSYFKAANSEAAVKKEIAQTISAVGKLIVLPTGEEPQMATVVDPVALAKEQPFYSGTIKGDKVLVYLNARKAIVYSPSRNLIVNAGPVYLNESAPINNKPTNASTKTKTSVATSTVN